MGRLKNHVGEKHKTNQGYEVEIIEYFAWNNCTLKFPDGLILYNVQYYNIKVGNVANPFHKTLHKVGYIRIGNYKCKINGKTTKEYSLWNGMITRCYGETYQEKHPTYKDVTVCEEWHNFQVFAEWFNQHWKPYMDNTWNLDKDLKIKYNKIYSPETCIFIPQCINKIIIVPENNRELPTGVRYNTKLKKYQARLTIEKKEKYLGFFNTIEEAFQAYKIEKESHIKEVAEKLKPILSKEIYKLLYNWKVEITD